MKVVAKAPKKADLRDKCRELKLTAESEADMEFLSKLYRCIVFGGGVKLEEKEQK